MIGGGLSGLTAAYRLKQAGAYVELYEAKKRFGGRVFSITVHGQRAELGGHNLYDGAKTSSLLPLIRELKLQTIETEYPLYPTLFHEGNRFRLETLIEPFQRPSLQHELHKLHQKIPTMQGLLEHLVPKSSPLYTLSAILLAAWEGAPVEKLSSSLFETLLYILQGGVSVAHPTGKKVRYLTVKGGNQQIADTLASKLHPHIHQNEQLTKISRDPTSDGFHLTFKNGRTVDADLLILAFPCTIFNHLEIPGSVIPIDQQTQMKELLYGEAGKICLPLDSPPGKSLLATNGRTLTFSRKERTLSTLFFPGATQRLKQKTLGQTLEKELPFLKKIYTLPDKISPIYADDSQDSYKGFVGYSWSDDAHIQGSYCCIGAGQESAHTAFEEIQEERVKSLFAPIDRRLFFAGEHTTTNLNRLGTMEAAVESGEITARLLLKHSYRA